MRPGRGALRHHSSNCLRSDLRSVDTLSSSRTSLKVVFSSCSGCFQSQTAWVKNTDAPAIQQAGNGEKEIRNWGTGWDAVLLNVIPDNPAAIAENPEDPAIVPILSKQIPERQEHLF